MKHYSNKTSLGNFDWLRMPECVKDAVIAAMFFGMSSRAAKKFFVELATVRAIELAEHIYARSQLRPSIESPVTFDDFGRARAAEVFRLLKKLDQNPAYPPRAEEMSAFSDIHFVHRRRQGGTR
jgi:hypothetical protein